MSTLQTSQCLDLVSHGLLCVSELAGTSATELAAASSHDCSVGSLAHWHSDLVWGLALQLNVLGCSACNSLSWGRCKGQKKLQWDSVVPSVLNVMQNCALHVSVFTFFLPRDCLQNNSVLTLGTVALNLRNWGTPAPSLLSQRSFSACCLFTCPSLKSLAWALVPRIIFLRPLSFGKTEVTLWPLL